MGVYAMRRNAGLATASLKVPDPLSPHGARVPVSQNFRYPRPLFDLLGYLGEDDRIASALLSWEQPQLVRLLCSETRVAMNRQVIRELLASGMNPHCARILMVYLSVHLARSLPEWEPFTIAEGVALACGFMADFFPHLGQHEMSAMEDRLSYLWTGNQATRKPAIEPDTEAPRRIHAAQAEAGPKQDQVTAWFKDMIPFLHPADFVIARQGLVDLLSERAHAERLAPPPASGLDLDMTEGAIDQRGALHMFYASYRHALLPLIRFGTEWSQSTPPRAGRRTICRLLRPRVQRHAEIVRGELAWLNHPEGGRQQIRFDPGPAGVVLRRLQDDLTRLARALRQASASAARPHQPPRQRLER
jgi:hypothetical protein